MSRAFRQLVVGVDFSPHSEKAVRQAICLQQNTRTGVTAVHVVDRNLVQDLRAQPGLDEEMIRDQAEQRLRKWLEGFAGPEHPVVAEAVVGHPFEALVHATVRHQADLLVLGSRGLKAGVGHPGAVAAKCLRKAPVDVLLVRQGQEGAFTRIVACIDFSPVSVNICATAASLAERAGGTLDVLHVHVPMTMADLAIESFPVGDSIELLKAREDLARHQLDQFVAALPASAPAPPPVAVMRTSSSATDGIVDFLNERAADLVVLGTRGRSGLRALLLGTTAERLVHEAPCSVLVVKDEGK